jgi:hypothetical protein
VISDPFMMLVPPSEQFLTDYTFNTLSQNIGFSNSYVNVVVCCYIGNGYGTSWAAEPYYEKMIRDFSSDEIRIMIESVNKSNSYIGMRLRAYRSCLRRFVQALSTLIDVTSVPETVKLKYEELIKIQLTSRSS